MNKDNPNSAISQMHQRIKESSDFQLKIIQHFYPKVNPGRMIKTHKEHSPSTSLRLSNGVYWLYNFSNSEKGLDCINVVRQKLNLSFPEAVKHAYSDILELPAFSNQVQPSYSMIDRKLFAIKKNKKDDGKAYLHSRCIDADILPKEAFFQSNQKDGAADAIIFIDSFNLLINKRYFDDNIRYKNEGKLNGAIYNQCYVENIDRVFLVEGVINALSIYPLSSIAIFSTSNTIRKPSIIADYCKGKEVILAFDNDEAGNECAEHYLKLIVEYELTERPIKRLLLPIGQDLNDILQSGNIEEFLQTEVSYKQLHPYFIKDSEDVQCDIENHGFYKQNSCYYFNIQSQDMTHSSSRSNFLMKSLYLLKDGTNDARRLILLQRKNGVNNLVQISSKELALNRFKAAIRSHNNYSFSGNAIQFELILSQELENEKVATELKGLGYVKKNNFYAFSNGVINPEGNFLRVNNHGVVEFKNSSYFIPAFSVVNIESDTYRNLQKFRYRKGRIGLESWIKLFFQAYGNNGSIGIAFTLASIFRDIIFKQLGFFPFLYLFGDYGVGKTSFVSPILSVFGENLLGISLEAGSTSKSIARNIGGLTNSIVYLKELSPQVEQNIIGFLKTAYDGLSYSRAQSTNDNKTHDLYVDAAIIIDGNYLPTRSSALFSRIILLSFQKNTFTQIQTEAYQKLTEYSEYGFGKVLSEIIKYRRVFELNFSEVYKELYNEVKTSDTELMGNSERSIKHYCLFLSVYKVFETKINFPFSLDDYKNHLKSVFVAQDEIQSNISDVNQFWHEIDFLISENKLHRGKNFKVVKKGEDEILLFSYNRSFPTYQKHMVSMTGNRPDKNTLLHFLKDSKAYVRSWQKNRDFTITDKQLGSAYAFNIKYLPININ